jgi:hypothetical protein
MVTKSHEHEVNQAGKRLLREVLEPLNLVLNDVQEDYAIDCNVQVFESDAPTGAWFHIQLKSSEVSEYSTNSDFVSQPLKVDHALHYVNHLMQPIFLVHVDVNSRRVFWHAPQVDGRLAEKLKATKAQFINIRIPTKQELPHTARNMMETLDNVRLMLAARALVNATTKSFVESVKGLPDQEALLRGFQEKGDTLKLQNARTLIEQKRYSEARQCLAPLLIDPYATVDTKFWGQTQLETMDYIETVHAGRPQTELSKLRVAHAKALQKLTAKGPNYLKFYALIVRLSADLEVLNHEYFTVHLAIKAHTDHPGNVAITFAMVARRSALLQKIMLKYNQGLRLARLAGTYRDRWMLSRAVSQVPRALGSFLATLRSEGKSEAAALFSDSALQICKLSASIGVDTGDSDGVMVAMLAALSLTSSVDSDAYRWSEELSNSFIDAQLHKEAKRLLERATARWQGKPQTGDYNGDVLWQAFQNLAAALGIETTDENDPLVRGLKLAAKDDSPERILTYCEHILVTQGATGPVAREIQRLFNTTRASSKVIHCTLHGFHLEGREQDSTFESFKIAHCNSCPDRKQRPSTWKFTDSVANALADANRAFVAPLVGTQFGLRYTPQD